MVDPSLADHSNSPASIARVAFGYRPADASAQPVLSIVTPFDRAGRSFDETRRCIFGQSCQEWEWLIVNLAPGETSSNELQERYGAGDARVRVIETSSLDHWRDAGLAAATTPYVLSLPRGSLLEPTAAEKWLWFLESHKQYDSVGAWSVSFGSEEALMRDDAPAGRTVLERSAPHSQPDAAPTGRRGTLPEYLEWKWRYPQAITGGNGDAGEAHLTWPEPPPLQLVQPGLATEASQEIATDEIHFANRLTKTKPRILVLSPWLTWRDADTWNLSLISGLTEAGWEVTVATTREGDDAWLPRFTAHSPDVFLLHRFLRPADYPRFLRYLIQSRGIDVVLITHTEFGYSALPYLRAHAPETAFLDYCLREHEEHEPWGSGGPPAGLLDGSIASSGHLRSWMIARGADPARVAVASPNIDVNEWRPDGERRARVRAELGIHDRVPLLLYPGKISAQQRSRVFARVIQSLADQRLDFLALVVGDGPDLPWLQSFVEKQRLTERVRFFGVVAHERRKDLFAAADIAFRPSHGEGVGLSAYQAMASEVAVVGAAVGGSPELVTPDCGVLIEVGTEEQEAEAYVSALTSLMRQPPRIHAMGRAARERVERHFRIEQMHQTMLTLLLEAMRSHRTRPQPIPTMEMARAAAVRAVDQFLRAREAELRASGQDAAGAAAHIRQALARLVRKLHPHRVPPDLDAPSTSSPA